MCLRLFLSKDDKKFRLISSLRIIPSRALLFSLNLTLPIILALGI